MIAIVFLVIIFNMATMFYFEGRKATMKYMDKAAGLRTFDLLAENFRNFVHANGKPVKVIPDNIVFSNQASLSIKNDKIVFTGIEKTKKFAVSKEYVPAFAAEKTKDGDILVLYLWRRGNKKKILKNRFMRIVAVSGGGEK
jgi:hypothetical protein